MKRNVLFEKTNKATVQLVLERLAKAAPASAPALAKKRSFQKVTDDCSFTNIGILFELHKETEVSHVHAK